MSRLQKVAQVLLACAVLFGANATSSAEESEDGNNSVELTRWAIIIDASDNSTPETAAALKDFRDALIESGISENNALVYCASADDSQKRPTRENIDALVEALRLPDDKILPEGKLRKDEDAPCEAMVFLTGLGVANGDTGEAYFAPLGVSESDVQDWDDPKLMPLNALEDALLYAEDGQKPLERTLFVVALNSPKTTTRGASADGSKRLNGVDLKSLPTRGTTNKDAPSHAKFAHLRIATENAKFDDRLVGSFYNAMRDGLNGSADVAGDQDGTVTADELASYLETTSYGTGRTVVVDRSGNDVYPLCKARKTVSIPNGLFDKLAKTFTSDKFKSESKSASARAKVRKLRKNKGVENAEEGVVVK